MRLHRIVLALAATVFTLSQAAAINRRADGGYQLLICTGANATGDCLYSVFPMDVCHDLPPPFLHNSSTFAPDQGDFLCYPYL
ncbi:hypothetical protein QBC35DRAFT_445952 [Podospora australis]|uniref:Uncharacterized protein n=1 Tax=Podospora australis TaxID=1536484 RepID=A0AAN7APG3_9PEZI|nr:hypothetical protein QBC35DRAFT_445952 [Podospora australis]